MKNPLEQFFTCEDRADGMYLKVNRMERDSVRMDVVYKTLQNSLVMNYDIEKIKDVVQRARGGFEKAGSFFEYYDEDIENYLQISITPIKASIKVSKNCVLKGKHLTQSLLMYFLKRKGIRHGIKAGVVAEMVTQSQCELFVDVAESTPAVDGTDAKIEFKIQVSPEIKPQVLKDGSVDYRSIQTFTPVSKGEILAIKHPPGIGIPGTTVTGETIAPARGNDLPLPNGRNTKVTADGMQLIACVTGILFYEGTQLTIGELLHIGGNVDFSSGNVKYTGDVLISGDVMSGFSVEAEGSIQIKGEVESAKILSRNGRVIIDKGIMGKGETIISAKEGITVNFAQDTTLQTDGTVVVDKYLLHCNVRCESLNGQGAQSSIIGGIVKAEKFILIHNCGSDKGVATQISMYDKQKAITGLKVEELVELQKKLSAELEPIERQLRTKAALMKRSGTEITVRQRDEVKKWVDAFNNVNKKIKYVQTKVEALKQEYENPGDQGGFMQVLGNIFPGTTLDFYGIRLPIITVKTNEKFIVKDQTIVIEG